MHLLNVHTSKIHEFLVSTSVKYAILSHTWADGEVSHAEWLSGAFQDKPGFAKIDLACRQAISDNLEWLWVDTCCIDKLSLTNLTEAINSMFRWYQESEVCYVFLADVFSSNGKDTFEPQLRKSRWFSRGWTLQELLAPAKVKFYSAEWIFLGERGDNFFQPLLVQITGIDRDVLAKRRLIQSVPIAARFSWISKRQTTKSEDLSYCLLGIFGVNMTLTYGEGGESAFIRLQTKIMKSIYDHSIFAWVNPDAGDHADYGMLATHPRYFRSTGNYGPCNELSLSTPYQLTVRGLAIDLELLEVVEGAGKVTLGLLNCKDRFLDALGGIYLRHQGDSADGKGEYRRVKASKLMPVSIVSQPTRRASIYVQQTKPSVPVMRPPVVKLYCVLTNAGAVLLDMVGTQSFTEKPVTEVITFEKPSHFMGIPVVPLHRQAAAISGAFGLQVYFGTGRMKYVTVLFGRMSDGMLGFEVKPVSTKLMELGIPQKDLRPCGHAYEIHGELAVAVQAKYNEGVHEVTLIIKKIGIGSEKKLLAMYNRELLARTKEHAVIGSAEGSLSFEEEYIQQSRPETFIE